MRQNRLTCTVIVCLLITWQKVAARPLSFVICTPEWAGFSEKDGTGLYLELLDLVFAPTDVKTDIVFAPFSRCLADTRNKQHFDATLAVYAEEALMIPDYPLGIDRISIAQRKENRRWQSVEDFDSKRVAWVRGYAYGKAIDELPELVKVEVNNVEAALGMLMKGRVDYVIDYESDIKPIVDERGWQDSIEIISNAMQVSELHIGLSDTPKNRTILHIWNTRMALLKASGELSRLYRQYGDPDY